MRGERGFWDIERLKELSAEGDPLEKLNGTVDFEMFARFCARRFAGLIPRRAGARVSIRVLKFRMLVMQTMHGPSLRQTEYRVSDRLSWMRF